MAWVRIHDGAMSHPKLLGLSDRAFRVWVTGLSYCQMHLTDGWIPRAAEGILGANGRVIDELIAGGLWRAQDDGWRVHDYLEWNDRKEDILVKRKLGAHRAAFLRDPDLKRALRDRDQDQCRYCGRAVNWQDRKGASGATYDHVDPRGDATLENLVIACRGCHSAKRNRTPDAAGLQLRPVPRISDPISDPITDGSRSRHVAWVVDRDSGLQREGVQGEPASQAPPRVGKQRPLPHYRRLRLFPWMVDDLLAMLGDQAEAFDLDAFLLDLDNGGTLLPAQVWPWLKTQVEAAARARQAPPADDCPHTPRCAAPGRWDCIRKTQMEALRA